MRRKKVPENADATGITSPIHLSSRSTWKWNRENRKDGHFLNVPSEWGQHPGNIRDSTIVEVPPEEDADRKSSVHFNPNAPVTHIYPPRQTSPEKQSIAEEHLETTDWTRRGSAHNPLSPVEPPGFLSAPPTPRYTVPKRSNVQKQYSFGRSGRQNLTEEETIGLVKAGQNEGVASEGDDEFVESPERTSEDSDSDSRERDRAAKPGRGTGRSYDMM